MSIRTGNDAIEVARKMAVYNTYVHYGTCLMQTRQYFNVSSLYPDAATGWRNAKYRHPTQDVNKIPRGVPIWWTGGSSGYGHVAISTGNGYCYSTDFNRIERVSKVRINDITNSWGLQFQGWTNDINGVTVYKPAERPIIHLSHVKPKHTSRDILALKRVLKKKGFKGMVLIPYFGNGLRKAYAGYQKRLGYKGEAADGTPGRDSLRKLGFRVRK